MSMQLVLVTHDELHLLCELRNCSFCEWLREHSVIHSDEGFLIAVKEFEAEDTIQFEAMFGRKMFKS